MLFVCPVVVLNAHGSLLRLFEPLVFTIGPVLVLDDCGRLGHLFPVEVLLITPVVILYDDGGFGLSLLSHWTLAGSSTAGARPPSLA